MFVNIITCCKNEFLLSFLCTSVVLNNSSIEEATKCLPRVLLQSKQSTGMCWTETEQEDGRKLLYDKCHFCTFCGTKIVSKISSHLVTVHKDKEAIKSILELPKGSRQRNLLLQTLVNEDNFKHNTSETRRGEGEVWADEVQ